MRRFLLVLRNEFALFRTTIPPPMPWPSCRPWCCTADDDHPGASHLRHGHGPDRGRTGRRAGRQARTGRLAHRLALRPPLELVDWDGGAIDRQVIRVEDRGGTPTAVQHFGMIDSNLVKNFRNRLTRPRCSCGTMRSAPRGDRDAAPLPARDVSYDVYFGMALLTMSAFLAAAIIRAMLTAQEFEFRTVAEYRLAPASLGLILGGRLVRLALSASFPQGRCGWSWAWSRGSGLRSVAGCPHPSAGGGDRGLRGDDGRAAAAPHHSRVPGGAGGRSRGGSRAARSACPPASGQASSESAG